jgi:large subunit ribosomal protein L9
MKLMLKTNVPKLGVVGEIVEVKKGFAMNYLLPQKLAVIASPGVIASAEKNKKKLEDAQRSVQTQLESLADKLDTKVLKLAVKVGYKGTLYAAIQASDVASATKTQLGLEVDQTYINLAEPIKTIGEHDVIFDFGSGHTATVKLILSEEK